MSEKAEQVKMLLQEQGKVYINVSMKLALGKYENLEVSIGKTVNEGVKYEDVFNEVNEQLEKELNSLKEIYKQISGKDVPKEPMATEKQKNLIKKFRKDVDVDKLTKKEAGKIIKEILSK